MTVRLLEDVELPATITAARTTSRIPEASQFRPSSIGTFSPQLRRGGSAVASATREISTAAPAQGPATSITVEFADRPPLQQFTLLMLKDGSGYLASDYWLEGTRLHFLTRDGENKLLPLEKLDSEETVRLNRERRVCASYAGYKPALTLRLPPSIVRMCLWLCPAILGSGGTTGEADLRMGTRGLLTSSDRST